MIGNAIEWCRDGYVAEYPKGPVTDPQGPDHTEKKVLRGGCWADGPRQARSAFRFMAIPEFAAYYMGFRPVVEALE